MKTFFIFIIIFLISYLKVSAAEQNYAVWFSPVRGRNIWRAGNDFQYLQNHKRLLDQYEIPNTWLIQYDALIDNGIVDQLKNIKPTDEIGLFLEVSKDWAWASFVNYDYLSEKWERADKLFLSGYRLADRTKLIDQIFYQFKNTFGYYPKTVGAWHVDGYSLRYMQSKYGPTSVLGLADQYLTDGYQVWGQYIGQPYYPDTNSVIEPAGSLDTKLNLVKFQWAPRHPLLGYGVGTQYSNFSAQLNDYFRDKKLTSDYFLDLLNIYTRNVTAPLAQITLGLEIGELDSTYLPAFEKQLQTLLKSQLSLASASAFANIYLKTYPQLSPTLQITATDAGRSITWTMSPQYRLGVLDNRIVDLRWYHQSSLPEYDQTAADTRQNLYQVVPAEIDSISLGNTASYSGLPDRPEFLPSPAPKTPLKYKIAMFLSRFVPDLRYSQIGSSHIIGLRTGPEHLIGLQIKPFKIGKFFYQFPYLESFINLNKYRYPQTPLPKFPQGAIYKNAPYGIDHLKKELLIPKSFENSLYLIPK